MAFPTTTKPMEKRMILKLGSKLQRIRHQGHPISCPLALRDAAHGVSALTEEASTQLNQTAQTFQTKLTSNKGWAYRVKKRKRLQVVAAPAATVTGSDQLSQPTNSA